MAMNDTIFGFAVAINVASACFNLAMLVSRGMTPGLSVSILVNALGMLTPVVMRSVLKRLEERLDAQTEWYREQTALARSQVEMSRAMQAEVERGNVAVSMKAH